MATQFANVSFKFKEAPQADLLVTSNSVAEKTQTDARFASIKDYVADNLVPANVDFSKALENAKGGGTAKTEAKNNKKKEVIRVLTIVAKEVDLIANGDAEIILAAGFEVRGTVERNTGDLEPVDKLTVNPLAISGEVFCSWTKVRFAKMYALEHAPVGSENWQNGDYSAGNKMTLKGLPAGDVKVRIRALGSGNKKSPWKEVNVKVY